MSLKCVIKDCNQRFSSRAKLKEHLIYVHNSYEATFICPEAGCNLKFDSLRQLRAHEKEHAGYSCLICSSKFLEEKYLKKHMVIHNDVRMKYQCPICEKEFLHKSNMHSHIRIKHEKVSFNCIFCGKCLSTKQKLNQHKNLYHKDQNLYMSVSEFNESQLLQETSPSQSSNEDSKSDLDLKSLVQDQLLKSESNQSCSTPSPAYMANLVTTENYKNEYGINNYEDMDFSCLDDLKFEDFDLTGDFLLQ